MNKYTLKVEGMMCPKCEARVVDAFKKETGAKKVAASHEAKECTVIADELTEELARKTVEKAGYTMTGFKREPYGIKGLFSK
ncbi:MAG: heavy-metal-associated domain-containing protein [Oscillospiraceae bacterium]|nr:heavy-metal-associated domain-containing protein [Oscillospiraceae bacterium]